MPVVATAGHVDHGKSTLVLALTGTDPDRLAEEKARGLTIDLGFASFVLPSGRELAFVDVPGHVRFLRNMLAGVGAVEACLFVVAATEGWKPQSEEHLRILELLGIRHGMVALTMAGLVSDDERELARLELGERLAGSFLEGAEIVEVDSISGSGVDEIRRTLDRLLDSSPPAADRGRPRLWIDRSFAAKGAGTVVTGTLAGGWLGEGDELLLLPVNRAVRVRALQSLHRRRERVGPGERCAVNLLDVSYGEVSRGAALVRPEHWHQSTVFDASLDVLASLTHEVSRRGNYVAYVGSGEFHARLRVLRDRENIPPGDSGFVRLYLDTALPLVPGDRYVLRETGRSETVGGGAVLDIDPVLPASRAQPDMRPERVIAERGWVDVDELARLTGVRRPADVGCWVVEPAVLENLRAGLSRRVQDAGSLGLALAGLDERERAVLDSLPDVSVEGGYARPGTAEDPLAGHPFLAALERAPFQPPAPDGVERDELRELVRRGLVVDAEGVFFARSALELAAQILAGKLQEQPQGFTVAEARDLLGSSRKHVLPLLGHLDHTGVTRRRGDLRIAGPRLPDSGRDR